MSGKVQMRLAVLAALAALVAVLVPSGLAFGDHGDPVVGPGEIIYLSLGKSPSSDVITFGDLSQSIPTKKNDCTAIDALNPGDENSILVVEEINALSLGEGKDHIGTLGPNDGAGEPCALASALNGTDGLNEGISVKIGEAAGDVLMSGFSVDVRLKGTGATVVATFYDAEGGELDGGEDFSFTAQADSGPDSADNYRWTVEPGFEFYEVRFDADAGSFALGGGIESDKAGAFDSTSFASQFQTVREFDGELTCGDTHKIEDSSVDPNIEGTVKMHSMQFDPEDPTAWVTSACLLKLFDDGVGAVALSFVPTLASTSARYTIEVTIENQTITVDTDSSNSVPDGTITSLVAVYDETGDLSFPDATTDPLLACEMQPVLVDDPTTTEVDEYEGFWTQEDVGLLPSGETACFYAASVTPTSPGQGTEHWGIYFEDDPSMRF